MKAVIDTSIFTNPDIYGVFGDSPRRATEVFLELAQNAQVEFFMPSSVYSEFLKVTDIEPLKERFEIVIRIRSPFRYKIQLPAQLLYEFIEEMRARVNRGLRIAEEHLKEASKSPEESAKLVNKLREKYREALRAGIIDSKEDLDVILLAFELDALLLSADEGLRKFADKLGIRLIDPAGIQNLLHSSLKVDKIQG
ncbi:MAG: RNA ligase partner protein [Aquificaceae bacterium]|nr:RNA ligase partner protein [Aquificaceae bacterium]MDW8237091.1 RNA ligase partner protein [Aquificaceae bacterium]